MPRDNSICPRSQKNMPMFSFRESPHFGQYMRDKFYRQLTLTGDSAQNPNVKLRPQTELWHKSG
jgi:hypothetical protein